MIGERQVTYQVQRKSFIYLSTMTNQKKKNPTSSDIYKMYPFTRYVFCHNLFLALGMLLGEADAKMERQKGKIKRQASELQRRLRKDDRTKHLKSRKK